MINIVSELITTSLMLILLYLAVQGRHLFSNIGAQGLGIATLGLTILTVNSLGGVIAHSWYFANGNFDINTLLPAFKLFESIGICAIIIGGLLWLPGAKKIVKRALQLDAQNQALSSAVNQSMTDLEKTRQALEDERLLFVSGPMATCRWLPGTPWKTSYASSNIFTLLGYRSDELTHPEFNFVKRLHPKDLDIFLHHAKEITQGDTAYCEFEARVKAKFDRYLWLLILFRQDKNEEGGIIGYLLDITKQKNAESEKEQHLRRWKFALASGNEGLWDLDLAKRTIEFSHGWQSMLGYMEESSPSTISELENITHPEDLPHVREEIDKHLRGDTHFFKYDHRIKNANNDYIWVSSHGKVMEKSESGKPLRMIGKHTNISHVRKMADQARSMQTELQLAQSSRTDFIQKLSNEIRPKLNASIGLTTSLAESIRNDNHRQQIFTLKSSLFDLLDVINDLSRFHLLKSGGIKPDESIFNLTRFCEEKVKSLLSLCREKNIDLSFDNRINSLQRFKGPQLLIGNLLDHLLSNAIKYTHQGEVQLSLHAISGKPSAKNICLSVIDTGIGLPTEIQRHLLDNTRNSMTDGVVGKGVGMATVKELISLLDGDVELESGKDLGTRINIRLALEQLPVPNITENTLLPLTPYTIYVVSASLYLTESLKFHLNQLGATTYSFSSLREGLNTLKSASGVNAMKVLILDNKLPQTELQLSDMELSKTGIDRLVMMTDEQMLTSTLQKSEAHIGFPYMENIDLFLHKPICPSNLESFCHKLLEKHDAYQKTHTGVNTTQNKAASKKVLIVDDIEANQIVAEEMVKNFGISPSVVSDGKQGLEAHVNDPYDLILMDCHMPVMDGFEATDKIREYESLKGLKRTPIIAVTANNQPNQRALCKKAGMDDVLFKPYSLEQMGYLLESRLGIDISGMMGSDHDNTPALVTSTTSSQSDQNTLDKMDAFNSAIFDRLFKTLKHERMSTLVAAFSRECAKLLEDLGVALETKEVQECRRFVHSIKSSAANLGAMKLSQLAKECEDAAQTNDLSFIFENQKKLTELFEEATTLIKLHLEKSAPQNPSR